MVHTKTSIFLFFLIFGTSVFPNGSPTGLAYARSGKMPGMTGMLDGMGSVMDLFQKFTYNSNSNQESGGKPQVVYGGVTHNENNRYRIQAEEQGERKSQFSETQTSVYKSDSVIEALKVQKRDTLNIIPESYVEQTNHVGESQSGIRLRRDLPNFDNFMESLEKKFDIPSNRTGQVNYFASRTYQSNNVYAANDDKDAVYGSRDVHIGNTYSDNPNGTNVYGPVLVQQNNTYRGKHKKAQYGASVTQIGNRYPEHPGKNDIYTGVVVQTDNTYSENPGNETFPAIIINQSNNTYPKSIENNKDALKPIIHQSGNVYLSSNDSETRMNTKNNTETPIDSAEWNATDNQGNSSSTNYDSSSHKENKTLSNEEREAYAEKHTEYNGQLRLSSNVLYSFSYSLIMLLKYFLF
ncbi:hypothetical protein ORF302 [Cotesia plutellae polydnavirus]|nr:hypothetical protein ORF302 [Cotesia plutellae polydnavirus]